MYNNTSLKKRKPKCIYLTKYPNECKKEKKSYQISRQRGVNFFQNPYEEVQTVVNTSRTSLSSCFRDLRCTYGNADLVVKHGCSGVS